MYAEFTSESIHCEGVVDTGGEVGARVLDRVGVLYAVLTNRHTRTLLLDVRRKHAVPHVRQGRHSGRSGWGTSRVKVYVAATKKQTKKVTVKIGHGTSVIGFE